MTKTELKKQIKELKEKQAELQKQIDELKQVKVEEQKERWKPDLGEKYYFVNSYGNIDYALWNNNNFDNWRYLTGNIFKTEAETEEYRKKIEIQSQFKNFVEERSEELDWKNPKQLKYFLYYDYITYELGCDYNNSHKHQGTIYASSEQILKDAVEKIGEENVKKYVLEVKE